MQFPRPVYLGIGGHADATTAAATGAGPERGFAAHAAHAAPRGPDATVTALYHVATAPPARPDVDLAAQVLSEADLPCHADAYAVTITDDGAHGFFVALERGATLLAPSWFDNNALIYLTAGDAGPIDRDVEGPPREREGVAVALSQRPGPLRLAALVTETNRHLQHLIDQHADTASIQRSTARHLRRVAEHALAETCDSHGGRRWIGDVGHVITPYPPTSAAHCWLRSTIDLASLEQPTEPPATAATDPSGPLILMRALNQLVDALNADPAPPADDNAILVISGCEGATVRAAVFERT